MSANEAPPKDAWTEAKKAPCTCERCAELHGDQRPEPEALELERLRLKLRDALEERDGLTARLYWRDDGNPLPSDADGLEIARLRAEVAEVSKKLTAAVADAGTFKTYLDGVNAVAAAYRRERDVERNQANEWLAKLRDARLALGERVTTAEQAGLMAAAAEREACALAMESATGLGSGQYGVDEPDQWVHKRVVAAAIRARGAPKRDE